MYTLVIPRPVEKQLDRIPRQYRSRILAELQQLQENPRKRGTIKLAGYVDEYRIRIGSYRVRYSIDDDTQTVIALHCLHRKDIYRK